MSDYALARTNMVECQLETNGVHDERLLEVFGNVPRELFVPEEKHGVAYIDEDLPLNDNSAFLMEPAIHARLLQAADIRDTDAVLNIGDMCGYSSAVLSYLASTVVTVIEGKAQLKDAEQIWESHDYCNIVLVESRNREGCSRHAPYDVIIVNGACSGVPEALLGQLSENGRLLAVVRAGKHEMGRAVLYRRIRGRVSSCILFDAATPYVPGLEAVGDFEF